MSNPTLKSGNNLPGFKNPPGPPLPPAEQDADLFDGSFSSKEINQFIDEMFSYYISHGDYDGYVGEARSRHFQMYCCLKSRISEK